MLLVVCCFAKINSALFHNFLTKYYIKRLRSTLQQTQFFERINCQNVDMNHESHHCVNTNIFGFDIALIMNLFTNGLRAGWASVLELLTGSVTVKGLDVPGLGQSELQKCQPAPCLTEIKVKMKSDLKC